MTNEKLYTLVLTDSEMNTLYDALNEFRTMVDDEDEQTENNLFTIGQKRLKNCVKPTPTRKILEMIFGFYQLKGSSR